MKYASGYVTVKANKREQVNAACQQAGLGPNFFSVPVDDDAKQVRLYAASASLTDEQWATLQTILDAALGAGKGRSAITKCARPSRAGWQAEKHKQLAQDQDQDDKPPKPDRPPRK